jgi:hypothetical protein
VAEEEEEDGDEDGDEDIEEAATTAVDVVVALAASHGLVRRHRGDVEVVRFCRCQAA